MTDRKKAKRKKAVQSLNVKDPEARRLAVALADLTGESLSRTVVEALRRQYEQLRRRTGKASVEELHSIAGHIVAQVKRPYVDHGELLYDETGLPK